VGGLFAMGSVFRFGTFVTLIICTLFASLMSSIVFYGPFSIVQRAMDSRQVIYLFMLFYVAVQ
jgi:integral membrane sensor domain MASE1